MIDHAAEQIANLCQQYQVFDLFTAYLPVGFWSSHYKLLQGHPLVSNVRWHLIVRDYDRRSWPSATKGFFQFKAKIPGWIDKNYK